MVFNGVCQWCDFRVSNKASWQKHVLSPEHTQNRQAAANREVAMRGELIRAGDYIVAPNGNLHNTRANPLQMRGAPDRQTRANRNLSAFLADRIIESAAPIYAARLEQQGIQPTVPTNPLPQPIPVTPLIVAPPPPRQPTHEEIRCAQILAEAIEEGKAARAKELEERRLKYEEAEKARQAAFEERRNAVIAWNAAITREENLRQLFQFFAKPKTQPCDIVFPDGSQPNPQQQARIYRRGLHHNESVWWNRFDHSPIGLRLNYFSACQRFFTVQSRLSASQIYRKYIGALELDHCSHMDEDTPPQKQPDYDIFHRPRIPIQIRTPVLPAPTLIPIPRGDYDDDYAPSERSEEESHDNRRDNAQINEMMMENPAIRERRANRPTLAEQAEDHVNKFLETKSMQGDERLILGFRNYQRVKIEELKRYMRGVSPIVREKELIKRWRGVKKNFKLMWAEDPERAQEYDSRDYNRPENH